MSQPILLVEDDLSFAQTILAALQPTGIRVEHCTTGELAIELLQNRYFPVIVVELIPASEDGISGGYVVKAIRKLPKERRPAVILLASGSASLRGLDRSTVGALLFKPLDFGLFTEYVVATYRRALSAHVPPPDTAIDDGRPLKRCYCGACNSPIAAWISEQPETFAAWMDAPCPGCGLPPRLAGGRSELVVK